MVHQNTPRVLRLVFAVSALSALALTSGCIAAAVGGGAVYMAVAQRQMEAGPRPVATGEVSYVEGSLVATFPAEIEPTARSVNATFPQLGYIKISEHADAQGDTLVARTGSDKRLEIKLESGGGELTKVTIRVGAFGDEGLSRTILERIKANLGGRRPGPGSSAPLPS